MLFGKRILKTEEELTRDIDRLFIVQAIIKSITGKSTFEEIAKEVLNQIENKMGYSGASISIVDIEKNTIQLKYLSDSLLSKLLDKIVLTDEAFQPIPLQDNKMTLTKVAALENRVIIDTEIKKFVVPPLTASLASVIQLVSNIKSMVAVPIKAREKVFAVLNFTLNKSKEEISENELKTLELFIDQLGIVIDNVLKYQEISKFNIQLKEEIDQATKDLRRQNEDLSSLYNLSSKVSQSLDPTTVAQTAVNSLPQDKFIMGAVLNDYIPKEDKLQLAAYTESALAYEAIKLLGDPLKYSTLMSTDGAEYNLAVKTVKQGVPQYTNDLNELLYPAVPKALGSMIKKVVPVKALASYPLTIRNKTIGAITYFLKDKTVEELTDIERQLLETYTYHIAIALENAELYKQQQIIQANLETALKEVQALRQHEQDMIDIMGHELRTPISIVRNALGMLELEMHTTGGIKKDTLAKFLDIAMESARREVKLVETLLSSAKADSRGFQLLFEKVDMVDVVNDSLEFFKKEAEKKGLQIKYAKPSESIFVYCDRTRIQEIMDNFLSNAVKYTDTGYIKIEVKKGGKFAWIEINDTGIGIGEEDLKQLGKKFYRVDQYMDKALKKDETTKLNVIRPGGTGLGLYVTFSLIQVMDGDVKVDSKLGVGSTFAFGMPLYNGQPTKQEQRRPVQELFKIQAQ